MRIDFEKLAPKELKESANRGEYLDRSNRAGDYWIEWGPKSVAHGKWKELLTEFFADPPAFRFEGGENRPPQGDLIPDSGIAIFTPLEGLDPELSSAIQDEGFDAEVRSWRKDDIKISFDRITAVMSQRDSLLSQLVRVHENLNVSAFPGFKRLLKVWLVEMDRYARAASHINSASENSAEEFQLDYTSHARYVWQLFTSGISVKGISTMIDNTMSSFAPITPDFLVAPMLAGLSYYGEARDSILIPAAAVDHRRLKLESLIAYHLVGSTLATDDIATDPVALYLGYTSEEHTEFLSSPDWNQQVYDYFWKAVRKEERANWRNASQNHIKLRLKYKIHYQRWKDVSSMARSMREVDMRFEYEGMRSPPKRDPLR